MTSKMKEKKSEIIAALMLALAAVIVICSVYFDFGEDDGTDDILGILTVPATDAITIE